MLIFRPPKIIKAIPFSILLSASISSIALAVPPETVSSDLLISVDNAIESTFSQEDYQEYLRSLEAESNENQTLSDEEAQNGYQIIDGIKYSPEEVVGDTNEEVSFNGVQPGANTGYVNFFIQPPEYVHENTYVIVTNLNTGDLYGCRTYEINGFQGQICIPSGIYMISEGGLSADTTGRFYAINQQFQVKSGSQQTIVVEIADTKPELADKAYPTEAAISPTQESNMAEEVPQPSTEIDTESQVSNPTIVEENQKSQSKLLTVILTIIFTIIPISIFWIIYFVTRKKQRGFYD